ncbi:unnamed protein product, partial [Amoebophrya sp. A25]
VPAAPSASAATSPASGDASSASTKIRIPAGSEEEKKKRGSLKDLLVDLDLIFGFAAEQTERPLPDKLDTDPEYLEKSYPGLTTL